MATPAVVHPPLTSKQSFDDAPHLVGELSADGVASLRAGPMNGPSKRSGTSLPREGLRRHQPPRRTRRNSSGGSSAVSSGSSTSWEDYDALKADPASVVEGAKGGGFEREASPKSHEAHAASSDSLPDQKRFQILKPPSIETGRPGYQRRKSIPIRLEKTDEKGRYLLMADDPELREIFRRGVERESQGVNFKRRSRFSDLVFTRQFTAFDRQNPASAGSTFHGFFTLFWLGTALMLMRVAADNWRTYGSVFGRNEILKMMFHREVAVLGLTDGIMCAATLLCLPMQKAIFKGYLSWNKQGWIIQNVRVNLRDCICCRAIHPSLFW